MLCTCVLYTCVYVWEWVCSVYMCVWVCCICEYMFMSVCVVYVCVHVMCLVFVHGCVLFVCEWVCVAYVNVCVVCVRVCMCCVCVVYVYMCCAYDVCTCERVCSIRVCVYACVRVSCVLVCAAESFTSHLAGLPWTRPSAPLGLARGRGEPWRLQGGRGGQAAVLFLLVGTAFRLGTLCELWGPLGAFHQVLALWSREREREGPGGKGLIL